jgi:glyoxylase-like metal-dependent hydrolase (beta-lactamase superfamily II)
MTNKGRLGGLVRGTWAAVMAVGALSILGSLAPRAAAQREPHPSANNPPVVMPNNPVQALFVQSSGKAKVYMLVGAGPGNITLQVGDEGVLLVDTGTLGMADQTIAAVKHLMAGLTDQPIRWIINTHFHPENTGGNEPISKAGEALVENSIGTQPIFGKQNEVQPATVIAQENVLKRMSARTGTETLTPADAWPLMTFFTPKKDVVFNNEPIEVIHVPAAHTDGDSLVFFRHSDVISSGGAFVTTSFPVLDLKAGGTINGNIDALNRIIDIAVPHDHQEGGTYIVPGEGRLCDEADVVEYRNMVVIIRDRIQDMIKRGMTLEQAKAAKPTADYDPRYATREWTPDMFVEAVYKSLPGRGRP